MGRIEKAYGKVNRVWVMDRGIPTEAVMVQMRQSEPPIHYLVGTPRSWLSRFEQSLLAKEWKICVQGIDVKLLHEGGKPIFWPAVPSECARKKASACAGWSRRSRACAMATAGTNVIRFLSSWAKP